MYVPSNMMVTISSGSTWIEIPRKSLGEGVSRSLLSLPSGLRMAPIKIFETREEEERRRLMINVYKISSIFMTGWRMEIVTVCHTPKRKDLHFDILSVYTDTLHWDPFHGIQLPNAYFVDRKRDGGRKSFKVMGKDGFFLSFEGVFRGKFLPIHKSFIEANRVSFFRNDTTPFPVGFDLDSICKDVSILEDTKVESSMMKEGIYREMNAFYHPYRMKYTFGLE
jgi:hypothetical protein